MEHFNNNTIFSCYFLMSELDINGNCSAISHFTNFTYQCRHNDMAFLLLLIPNFLQGIFYLLVFMTALEFICAQAPLQLKGLLVGVWYALLAINYLVNEVPELFTVSSINWTVFHAVKGLLVFLSLILFLFVSKRYRYRQRDEVVNERLLVEEIFERELDLAEEYEKEADKVDHFILKSAPTNYRRYGSTANSLSKLLPKVH